MITKVLLVDPSIGFAVGIKRALEQPGGYRVMTFANGQAALDLVRTEPQDVAILDFEPDDMDIMSLIMGLREIQPGLTILVSPRTAGQIVRVPSLNVNGSINKPYLVRQLIPVIREALAARARQSAATAPLSSSRPMASVEPNASGPADEPAEIDQSVDQHETVEQYSDVEQYEAVAQFEPVDQYGDAAQYEAGVSYEPPDQYEVVDQYEPANINEPPPVDVQDTPPMGVAIMHGSEDFDAALAALTPPTTQMFPEPDDTFHRHLSAMQASAPITTAGLRKTLENFALPPNDEDSTLADAIGATSGMPMPTLNVSDPGAASALDELADNITRYNAGQAEKRIEPFGTSGRTKPLDQLLPRTRPLNQPPPLQTKPLSPPLLPTKPLSPPTRPPEDELELPVRQLEPVEPDEQPDPVDYLEPIEQPESAEQSGPTVPVDQDEPIEQLDLAEQFEPVDQFEAFDPHEVADQDEPIEQLDVAEQFEPVGQFEAFESPEAATQDEPIEQLNPAESFDQFEVIEPAMPADEFESVEQFEPVEQLELIERYESEEQADPLLLPEISAIEPSFVAALTAVSITIDNPIGEADEFDDIDSAAEIAARLTHLAIQSTAYATILTRAGELVASAGELSTRAVAGVVETIAQIWQTTDDEETPNDNVSILPPRIRYIQVPGVGDFALYSIRTIDSLFLSVLFPADTSLRLIRQQARRLIAALEQGSVGEAQESRPGDEEPDAAKTQISRPTEPLVPIGWHEAIAARGIGETGTTNVDQTVQVRPKQIDTTDESARINLVEIATDAPQAPPTLATIPDVPYSSYTLLWLPQNESSLMDIADQLSGWIQTAAVARAWKVSESMVSVGCVCVRIDLPADQTPRGAIDALQRAITERANEVDLWAEAYYVIASERAVTPFEIAQFVDYRRPARIG